MIGANTLGGVTFGIETTGNTGVPDFPDNVIYNKVDIPYANPGRTNLQQGGKKQLGTLQLTIVVEASAWAQFVAKAGAGSIALQWASKLGRASRAVRLMAIEDKRQFPDAVAHWRARITLEG